MIKNTNKRFNKEKPNASLQIKFKSQHWAIRLVYSALFTHKGSRQFFFRDTVLSSGGLKPMSRKTYIFQYSLRARAYGEGNK